MIGNTVHLRLLRCRYCEFTCSCPHKMREGADFGSVPLFILDSEEWWDFHNTMAGHIRHSIQRSLYQRSLSTRFIQRLRTTKQQARSEQLGSSYTLCYTVFVGAFYQ